MKKTFNVIEITSFSSKRREVINSVLDANENTFTAIQNILIRNSMAGGSFNKELLENLKQQAKDTIKKNFERIKKALEYFEETENGKEYLVDKDLEKIKELLSEIAKCLISDILLFSDFSKDYETGAYKSLDKEQYFKKLKNAIENIKRGIFDSNRLIELFVKLVETIIDKGMVAMENPNNLLEEPLKGYGEKIYH